jgi:hypothetical protein
MIDNDADREHNRNMTLTHTQTVEATDAAENIDFFFEEVDLFSTALIQGGCTRRPTGGPTPQD